MGYTRSEVIIDGKVFIKLVDDDYGTILYLKSNSFTNMIKCTGNNCTLKTECMRYKKDIETGSRFDGVVEPSEVCHLFIPHPETPDDDLAKSKYSQNRKE